MFLVTGFNNWQEVSGYSNLKSRVPSYEIVRLMVFTSCRVCHKYELKFGRLLVVTVIQPRTSGLSYWLIERELLFFQALVIGYLGLGYWRLFKELRQKNSWYRSQFWFRFPVSYFSLFLGRFWFLLFKNS